MDSPVGIPGGGLPRYLWTKYGQRWVVAGGVITEKLRLREWLLESRVLPVITQGEVASTVQLRRTLAAAAMLAAPVQ